MRRQKTNSSPPPPLSRVQRAAGGSPSPRRRWLRWFTRKWFFLVLFTSLLLVLSGFLFFKVYVWQMNPQEVDRLLGLGHSSQMVDQKGNPVGPIGNMDRHYIPLSEVLVHNPELPEAFKAIEDQRFDEHAGIDLWALLRAMGKNIWAMRWKQGASTIDMQVMKNLEGRRNKNLWEKAVETFKAIAMRQKLTDLGRDPRQAVMEAYLNIITMDGARTQGIGLGAKVFFAKDIRKEKLTPAEVSAIICAIRGPNLYGPLAKDPAKALRCRNMVLLQLAQRGVYAESVVEAEREKPLPVVQVNASMEKLRQRRDRYAPYRELVQKELAERYGLSDAKLNTGSYVVYTGLQPQVQDRTAEVADKQAYYTEGAKKTVDTSRWDMLSATVDPRTGLVMAIGAGRYYKPGDRITGAVEEQQWGSVLKPLAVFGPAIEEKGNEIHEQTRVDDTPLEFPDGWKPRNYDGEARGPNVPLGQVVGESLNISAVRFFMEHVGIDLGFKTLERLGLKLTEKDRNPAALVLGGQDQGNTALSMVGAFSSVLDGRMICPHFVERVLDATGKEVEPRRSPCERRGDDEPEKAPGRRVFKPETVEGLQQLLHHVRSEPYGTARHIRLPAYSQPVFMKTGTTNEHQAASVCMAALHGVHCTMVYNPDRSDQENHGVRSGGPPARMAQSIMEVVLRGKGHAPAPAAAAKEVPASPPSLGPLEVEAVYREDTQSIHLSWNVGAAETSTPVSFTYRVRRRDDEGREQMLLQNEKHTSLQDTAIEADRTYTYIVEMQGSGVASAPQSAQVKITTGSAAASAPESL